MQNSVRPLILPSARGEAHNSTLSHTHHKTLPKVTEARNKRLICASSAHVCKMCSIYDGIG